MIEKKSKIYSVKSSSIGKASIKDVDLKKRIVTGFYNAYNFVDDGMDVLLDGCCKQSIKQNGPESNSVAKIKHALFHDITRLPGKILVLEERTVDTEKFGSVTGPYFETQMDSSTEGNDTLIKYQAGVYDNHSIGYRELQAKKIERDGQHGNSQQWNKFMDMLVNPKKAEDAGYFYAVSEIRLFEGSTVGFGMNELTPYLGVKGKEQVNEIQLMERFAKLESILKIKTLSDDALQSAEIQIMQLKQIMTDLFSQKWSVNEKEIVDCQNCGEEGEMSDDGTCPKCGEQMKAAPLTLFQKMAKVIQ